jgi:hypothetical protein
MRFFEYETRSAGIATVQEFLWELAELRDKRAKIGSTWFFRGDRAGAGLRPKIGQPLSYGGKTFVADDEIEKKFLNSFKRFAYQEIREVKSDWEVLFLARHFGLPTRLLDWTANPLVALYFACSPEARDGVEGALWAILRFPDESYDIDVFSVAAGPLSLYEPQARAVKLIYPVYNSGRITAQEGLFSWHSHPRESLESWARRPFDDSQLDIAVLAAWRVSVESRTTLLEELERLGVNQRTIFPDLEGITKGIWQSVVLRSGL